MEIPLLNLTRLHAAMRDELDQAIARVIQKSSFILGEETEAFEKEFSEVFNKKFAVGVGNGTDAITLTLMAMGIGPGDDVITTSLSAFPTSEAILRTGATPVYVDIDEHTFNLAAEKVESAITKKTKAIVPVHLYGLAADLDTILAVARTHNLPVVEDCAQAHGATYHKQLVGTFGVASCFSFFPSKNLGAMGDGGMVLTDDEEIAKKVKSLRAHGEEGRFNHKYVGFNSRLDGIQAAILRIKLKYLKKHNQERQAIAAFYQKALLHTPLLLPGVPSHHDAEHVYHLYVVRVPEKSDREPFRKHLEAHGVKTNVHYPTPLHRQPAFPVSISLPQVEKIVDHIVSIPLFPTMTEEEMQVVADAVQSWNK